MKCPSVIQKYSKYMGGVEWFDKNIDHFRVGLRGKKWWSPLFEFGIHAVCQNALHLMKKFRCWYGFHLLSISKSNCPDICQPLWAACTERRWQFPNWYPSAPRSNAWSRAAYRSRLLPEKVLTVPSKDTGDVPKVPGRPAHTLMVRVSYPEMRYKQWKSF